MHGESTRTEEDHVTTKKSIPEKWVGEKIRLTALAMTEAACLEARRRSDL
jgi:hypothetical protein